MSWSVRIVPPAPHDPECRAAIAPIGEARCDGCAWIVEQQALVRFCLLVDGQRIRQHFDGWGRG